MQRHGALGGVEHEQLAPAQPQQGHLVRHLQVREEGDVAGPLHGTEEQAGGQFADVLDAHDVGLLHGAVAEAGCGVGLGPQQHGDEGGQVGVAVEGVAVGEGHLARERVLGRRDAATLHGCWVVFVFVCRGGRSSRRGQSAKFGQQGKWVFNTQSATTVISGWRR